jgi:hypothetical protein
LYQAQATKAYADAADTSGGGAGEGKIWCDVLNGYSTPTQCNNARLKTTAGQLQQNYGLKPDDLFNSATHEAGNVVVDPTSGNKTFNPDPTGTNIRIGARDPQSGAVDPNKGVFMPMQEFNIYKRQLGMSGYQPGGAAAPAAGGGAAGGGAQDPKQAQAIAILQQNGKPLTQANINYVIQKLGGGQ